MLILLVTDTVSLSLPVVFYCQQPILSKQYQYLNIFSYQLSMLLLSTDDAVVVWFELLLSKNIQVIYIIYNPT